MKHAKIIPSRLPQRFLLRFIRDDLAEEVLVTWMRNFMLCGKLIPL